MSNETKTLSSPAKKQLRFNLSDMTLYIGAIAIIIIFTVICQLVGRSFLNATNIQNIITQSAVIAVIAIGSSLVILTGGIDLSVGSIVGFVGIFAGLIIKAGLPVWLAVLCSILAGVVFGGANGLLISKGKVPAFITTLGCMQVARGLALLINSGKPISSFPNELGSIMNNKLLGVPLPILYVFVLYFIVIVIMGKTRFGRHLYAVGGNIKAAKLSGVRTQKIVILAYILSGLFAAVGGIMLLSRLSYADPNAGGGYEMNAIAATVIGGISLSGGKGKVGNTLVGALILGSLTCGLQILNVPTYYQTIITGIVIAAAVYADKSKERKAE